MLLNNVNKYFSAIKNLVLNADENTQPEAVEINLQESIITGLSVQKKEMIATYVSYLHDAFFGQGNALQNHAFHEYAGQPMPVKLKALIGIASTYAKSIGATEQEIHDTVLVPSVFCSYQRSVDVVVSNKSIAEKAEPRTYTTPVISLQDRKKETA